MLPALKIAAVTMTIIRVYLYFNSGLPGSVYPGNMQEYISGFNHYDHQQAGLVPCRIRINRLVIGRLACHRLLWTDLTFNSPVGILPCATLLPVR